MNRVLVSNIYPLADELRAPFLTAVGSRLSGPTSAGDTGYLPLLQLLGGLNINVGMDPANKPANGKWLTVGYEVQNGPVPIHEEGWLTNRIHIKSECRRNIFSFVNAMAWHSEVHAEVATRLLGYQANINGGVNGGIGVIKAQEEQSDSMLTDMDDDTYYFASFFSTEIIAAHAA